MKNGVERCKDRRFRIITIHHWTGHKMYQVLVCCKKAWCRSEHGPWDYLNNARGEVQKRQLPHNTFTHLKKH